MPAATSAWGPVSPRSAAGLCWDTPALHLLGQPRPLLQPYLGTGNSPLLALKMKIVLSHEKAAEKLPRQQLLIKAVCTPHPSRRPLARAPGCEHSDRYLLLQSCLWHWKNAHADFIF